MKDSRVLFGRRIKELRKLRGLSQDQLSERVGIESKHLSRIEVGRNFPSMDTLVRIAEALGVELKDCFEFSHEVATLKELREIIVGLLKEASEEKLRVIVKVLRAIIR